MMAGFPTNTWFESGSVQVAAGRVQDAWMRPTAVSVQLGLLRGAWRLEIKIYRFMLNLGSTRIGLLDLISQYAVSFSLATADARTCTNMD
jgi:hypothetical protein